MKYNGKMSIQNNFFIKHREYLSRTFKHLSQIATLFFKHTRA